LLGHIVGALLNRGFVPALRTLLEFTTEGIGTRNIA
jgi:hypothetical protein